MTLQYNLEYIYERYQELTEAADFYITPEEVEYTEDVMKTMKKNPALRDSISSTKKQIGVERLVKCTRGDLSFKYKNSARGIGEKGKSGKFVVNWIGSHEAYNKVKNQ